LKYLLSGSIIPGPLTYAISGAFCGVVAWCLVFPIDTAKVYATEGETDY
jgi:ribose/xylose/arabinose/galactoside ABC-type transport system permease subunit